MPRTEKKFIDLQSFEQASYCKTVYTVFEEANNKQLTLKELGVHFKAVKPYTKTEKLEAPIRGMISRWRTACKGNILLHGISDCKETVPHRVCSKPAGKGRSKNKLYWLCSDIAKTMAGKNVFIPKEKDPVLLQSTKEPDSDTQSHSHSDFIRNDFSFDFFNNSSDLFKHEETNLRF